MNSFCRELRVHALAEPGLLGPPAQPLGSQQVIDAAPFDRQALGFIQVRLQPVQGPGAKREIELLRVGQGGADHAPDRLGAIRRRATRPRLVFESRQAGRIEALDPGPHGVGMEPELRRDGWGRRARRRGGDDAGAFDPPRRLGPGMGHLRNRRALRIGHHSHA
jgi:hypothetical protein